MKKTKNQILVESANVLRDLRDDKGPITHAALSNLVDALEAALSREDGCNCEAECCKSTPVSHPSYSYTLKL